MAAEVIAVFSALASTTVSFSKSKCQTSSEVAWKPSKKRSSVSATAARGSHSDVDSDASFSLMWMLDESIVVRFVYGMRGMWDFRVILYMCPKCVNPTRLLLLLIL